MTERQPSRDEIVAAARFAGIALPPAYEDELVEAYGHVRHLVAMLPAPRARADEPAHAFHAARFAPPEG